MESEMKNLLEPLSEARRWRLLVDAAKDAIEQEGYTLRRVPGRGLSNVWDIERDGKTLLASIRTTRDRAIAFPPLENGAKWKTLSDVEVVVVATVDSKEDPRKVEVFFFPADDVRKHFDAAYAARKKAGHANRDNFGMWVALDADTRNIASSVGSGLTAKYRRVAVYSIEDLLAAEVPRDSARETGMVDETVEQGEEDRLSTIAEVMDWARRRVAEIAGVRVEAVKLDLKVEY